VHRRAGVALDTYLNAGRLGKVPKNLRRLALGDLSAVEIDANLDATIGGARERLPDGPIRQDISCHVDFMFRPVDQRNVDVFKVSAGA
jgi:hypothetical protein